MKTIKFFSIIAALTFLTVSCVEKSDKYKAAIAQRDSLAVEKQVLDSNYNRTIDILNDIETGFSEISHSQNEMRINLKGVEGKTTSKKELIAAQMGAIKVNIENNKAKIDELRKLAAKSDKANKLLSATIQRLQTEMDEKNKQIETLQVELDQKNIKISELSTIVNDQNNNITEQQKAMEEQKSRINELNAVWYCVATSKVLKNAKIITNTGLFQSKKVMDTDFDKTVFTQTDLRTLSTVQTDSKTIKIISSHPQDSYKLVTGDDKNITIEIGNPTKFWSVSKYLVVQI